MAFALFGVVSLEVIPFLVVSLGLAAAAYLPERPALRLDAAAILRGQ